MERGCEEVTWRWLGLPAFQAEDHRTTERFCVRFSLHESDRRSDYRRLVNQRYEWEPKIWDPQAASETIKVVFKSPAGSLPSWLRWEDSLIHADRGLQFTDGAGNKTTLETDFTLQAVLPHLMPLNDS